MNIKDHTSVKELTEITGLPTLNQISVESTLLLMWNSRKDDLPLNRQFELSKKNEALRSSKRVLQLNVPKMNRSRPEWLIHKGAILWNNAPDGIKSEESARVVKKVIKTYAKDFSVV